MITALVELRGIPACLRQTLLAGREPLYESTTPYGVVDRRVVD
jgi:hypothetical protein